MWVSICQKCWLGITKDRQPDIFPVKLDQSACYTMSVTGVDSRDISLWHSECYCCYCCCYCWDISLWHSECHRRWQPRYFRATKEKQTLAKEGGPRSWKTETTFTFLRFVFLYLNLFYDPVPMIEEIDWSIKMSFMFFYVRSQIYLWMTCWNMKRRLIGKLVKLKFQTWKHRILWRQLFVVDKIDGCSWRECFKTKVQEAGGNISVIICNKMSNQALHLS